jgi:hypothetical protein
VIYPDVPLEQWLKKYPALKIVTNSCKSCGSEISTDKPFVATDYVGLEAHNCQTCGNNQRAMSILITGKSLLKKWENII